MEGPDFGPKVSVPAGRVRVMEVTEGIDGIDGVDGVKAVEGVDGVPGVEVVWLDANSTADALAASQESLVAAEVEQVRLVAHWADVCNGDTVHPAGRPGRAGGVGGV